MKETLEFKLSTPIKEVYKGNKKDNNTSIEVDTLFLKAPTYKHKDHILKLKQAFLRRMISLAGKSDDSKQTSTDEEDSKLDSKAIKAILLFSEYDISEYFKLFKDFCMLEICFIDDKFNCELGFREFNKLSIEDTENLVALYLENFFSVSWLRTVS